jgi:ferredoxin-NADP reductase
MGTATKTVITAKVTKVHDINDRITYYEFAVDLDYGLTYIPGQFLMLIMPNDPRPVRRAYSIASTPTEIAGGLLKLCITAVEGGKVSNWIHTKTNIR